MAGETITLSGMSRAPQSINDSDLLFISKNEGTDKESFAVSAGDLQAFIFKENAYASVDLGLAATENNDSFYVYTDDTKFFVTGYINRSGVANVILNTDSTVRTFVTNYYFNNVKNTESNILVANSITELKTIAPAIEGQRIILKGRIADVSKTVGQLPWAGVHLLLNWSVVFLTFLMTMPP